MNRLETLEISKSLDLRHELSNEFLFSVWIWKCSIFFWHNNLFRKTAFFLNLSLISFCVHARLYLEILSNIIIKINWKIWFCRIFFSSLYLTILSSWLNHTGTYRKTGVLYWHFLTFSSRLEPMKYHNRHAKPTALVPVS